MGHGLFGIFKRHLNRVRRDGEADGHDLRAFQRSGDRAAFLAIIDRHLQSMWSQCEIHLGHGHDVQDALQQSFLLLLTGLGRLREPKALSTWIWLTTRSAIVQVYKSRNYRRNKGPAKLEELAAMPVDPSAGMIHVELRERIDAGVAQLEPIFQEVLRLHLIEGLSRHEVGQRLGLREGTVRKRLQRSLPRLAERLRNSGLVVAAVGTPAAEAANIAEAAWRTYRWSRWLGLAKITLWMVLLAVGTGLGVAHVWQAETPSPEPPNLVGAPRVVLAADRLLDAQVETLPEKNLRLMKTEVAPRVVSALQGLARSGRITLNEADTYAAGSWIVVVFDIDWGALGWKSRLRYRFDVFSRLTMVWWDDWGKNQWRDIDPTKPIILVIDWPVHRKLEVPVPALQQATTQLHVLPLDDRSLRSATAAAAAWQAYSVAVVRGHFVHAVDAHTIRHRPVKGAPAWRLGWVPRE